MPKKNKLLYMVDMYDPRSQTWPPEIPYSRTVYVEKLNPSRLVEFAGTYNTVTIRLMQPDEEIQDGK